MSPQPGDFRIVPVPGWGGLGIQVGQFLNGQGWSRHDHAEIYLGDCKGEGTLWTASSYPNRSGLRAYAPVDGEIWSSGVIPLTDAQRSGIIAWCMAHQHVGYSGLDYAELTLHHFGIKDPALQRAIASSKRMICSYYVDAAYDEGGDVHLFQDGRWKGDVDPADLAALVRR
jgi:hypothetical protein